MATQADFTNLEQLRLLDHGDGIERFYWSKVSSAISEYEVFWKRFVVLLTNRVNPLELSPTGSCFVGFGTLLDEVHVLARFQFQMLVRKEAQSTQDGDVHLVYNAGERRACITPWVCDESS